MFWQRFRQHTKWDLEVDSGSGWVSVKSDLQIIRDYPEPNHVKITLIFDASESGNYRLTFAIDKRVKNYVEKIGQYQYNLTYDGFSVVFDWSDVMSISGIQISHGVLNDYFWFRIRRDNVPLGAHVEIDPSIVAEDVKLDATYHSYQRKIFVANGRFWVFYSNQTHMVFKTSTDGSSWSSATVVRASTDGYQFSVWFDGTYIHYAYCAGAIGGAGQPLTYRRGTTNSDGTITWSADEQTAYNTPTGNNTYRAFVCVDSNGYPFIGFQRYNGSNYPYVTKSTWNNGSWSTASGFPYALSTPQASWYVSVVPLTSNRTYVVYTYMGEIFSKGRLWNGTNWGNEETITDLYYYTFSMTNKGDDVHLVYTNRTTNDILYCKRAYGSGWGTPQIIGVGDGLSSPILTVDGSKLFVVWATDNTIYFKGFVNSWKTTYALLSDSELRSDNLNSVYEKINGKFAVTWLSGISPSFLLKFQQLIYSVVVDSFTITNIDEDFPILSENWNDINKILSFETSGNVTVDVGEWGQPLYIETDNELFTDWSYDKTLNRITLNEVESLVTINFPNQEPIPTGTFTTLSENGEEFVSIVTPIQKFPMLGLYVVIGGIGIFTISAIWKKASRPTRRKPRGVQSPKAPRKRSPRKTTTPRKQSPRKPTRSKRSGRFVK